MSIPAVPSKAKQYQGALPPCGLFFGSGVYYSQKNYLSLSGLVFTTWYPESISPLEVLELVIKENQGNLVQLWGFSGGASKNADQSPVIFGQYHALEDIGVNVPQPDWEKCENLSTADWPEAASYAQREGAGVVKFVKEAASRGLYSTVIYTEAKPEWSERLGEVGEYYLGYDFGERFAFRLEEAHLESANPNAITLETISDRFIKQVREHVCQRQAAGWGNIMATSASFHLDYEVAAGVDIPLAEDFAFSHLNMASALSRGLQRQYQLPLWGSHMAHEHYSWIPNESAHKFDLLTAAFQQKYMAGCKIVINESGNWFLQAKLCIDSPMFELPTVDLGDIHCVDPYGSAPYVRKAEGKYSQIDFSSSIARKYRKTISDFYDFVKAHGTPAGQPETTIAIAKGNYDLCGHEYHPNAAIAGAYTLAENNPLWFEGAPERGWDIVKRAFYPRPDVLAPYPNRFLSGTPYGMVDIVSFAKDHASADFLLANYKAVLFAGWNTASEKQVKELTAYVDGGGTLFIAIPHLSKNVSRNYSSYTIDELVNRGDFSELCGVRIKGKGRRFYWATSPHQKNGFGFEFPRRFGIMATCVGDIEIVDPQAEVLVIDDAGMAPVLVRHQYGRGTVYFLNSWAYPGALDRDEGPGSIQGSTGLVGTIYRQIACLNRGSVWISDDGVAAGKECEFIAYSYFPESDNICLQNVDFRSPHQAYLHRSGKIEPFELSPGEFRVL